MPTLSEIIKEQDKSGANGLPGIVESQNEVTDYLRQIAILLHEILDRENPEQKEVKFPDIQKVLMDKPSWYKEPIAMDLSEIVDSLSLLQDVVRSEGDKTRKILSKLVVKEDKEVQKVEVQAEAKTVNTGAVRSRRTTQWKIATNPQANDTLPVTGAVDGVNDTYYLPSACIPNSETVRLNGGIPLSHGVDYSVSGNKITFIIAPPLGSQMEIRYQTK